MRDKPQYRGISVDTDLHYDLDLSRFPGLDDPQKSREPTLLIQSSEQFCFQSQGPTYLSDTDDVVNEPNDHCVRSEAWNVPGDLCASSDDTEESGCVFCDALNGNEESDSLPAQIVPCYLQNTLYIFHDAHGIGYQTVDVIDDIPVGLNCIYYEDTNLDHENPEDQESSVFDRNVSPYEHVIFNNLTFTELSTCRFDYVNGIDFMDMSTNLASPVSAHMDASITEQLPLFIDLVDSLSPILSPSGSVRPRKGANSACTSDAVDRPVTYFVPNDTDSHVASSTSLVYACSSPIFSRWS